MIEVGKCYYFFTHAYHHFIGEVAIIEGKQQCTVNRVHRIQGCSRNWTLFFRDGAKDDTDFTIFPDGTELTGWFVAAPWNHPMPKRSK